MIDLPETNLPTGGNAFIVTKGSYLKEILDFQIQRNLQAGLVSKIVRKYLKTAKEIIGTSDCGNGGAQPLGFSTTFLPFALLFVSLSLSIIMFLFEKFCIKKKNSLNENTQVKKNMQEALLIINNILSDNSLSMLEIQQDLVKNFLQALQTKTSVRLVLNQNMNEFN